MKLQILVPQYKETDDMVKTLLNSLALQTGVDFNDVGVVICNDGTDVHLSDELLNSYPFKIEYYLEPHRGVSGTRNACLDHATADYVMFCDADDMFFTSIGLYSIINEINIGFETLSSLFVEEVKTKEGKMIYTNHENDGTFVHGKIHNRQFLIDKGIRWNEALTIHEDSYFNVQCFYLAKEPKYLGQAFYMWRWRPDSVCRQDPLYIQKTYYHLIRGVDALVEKLEAGGRHDKAIFYSVHMVMQAYYEMYKPNWQLPICKEYIATTEKYIYNYYKKYQNFFYENSLETRLQIAKDLRNNAAERGMLMEKETFDQWLTRLAREYSTT